MPATIVRDGSRLVRTWHDEICWVEPWGADAVRVRFTRAAAISTTEDWALLPPARVEPDIVIADDGTATLVNGAIRVEIDGRGWLSFHDAEDGTLLLREQWQVSDGGAETSQLGLAGRELEPILGGDWRLTARFWPQAGERLYGMGQRQVDALDMKGCTLELAHRNSQASIPFVLSNRGYGFLWNNPAIGRATFAKNVTEWTAERATQADYWVTAGRTPAGIMENYARATGFAPTMPDWATGFWQCKLRYKTQAELLDVAREHKRRGLPLSVIVADFFHWTRQGDWKFDPADWPDPAAMVAELREMGVQLMVSIWPTVEENSENWDAMWERNYLVRTDRGTPALTSYWGNITFADFTHADARAFVWSKAREHYWDDGVRVFWLDEAEPDMMSRYEYDWVRFHAGTALEVAGIYPLRYAQAFYEGQLAAGQEDICNLVRCAWAGSQRYGALLWSGDVHSTFESFRMQFKAGLSAGLSGIPWWTSDIGGFTGGRIDDPAFRELLIRWFQFGVFCPVTRLHGFREPIDFDFDDAWRTPGGRFGSGADNEVWSYGEEVYSILRDCLFQRERLRDYVATLMDTAHTAGAPPLRPLFYDFPADPRTWEIEDQAMFGPNILIAPIFDLGARSRPVYLPSGARWVDASTGAVVDGGTWLEAEAPLERMPVYVRDGAVEVLSRVNGGSAARVGEALSGA